MILTRVVFLVSVLGLLLQSGPVAAQEQVEQETRTEESFIPNYAVAGSYFTWVGDSDFSDAGGSLSQWETGIDANVPLFLGDGLRITGGVKYRLNRLEFSGAPAPLGNSDLDLHRLDVPFNLWQDFNDRWKLWVRLQPGLYSDFDNIGSDDLVLTSLALLSYRWTDSLRFSFGAYYSRDLGEEKLLPAFGVIYEPNSHWSLGLTFPRANIVYAPNEDWLISARALLSGAGWNITDPAGGGSDDVDLNYQSLRVGVGIDRRLSGPWWIYVDGGAQLAQELDIDGGNYDFAEDLENSWYISGGIKLRF